MKKIIMSKIWISLISLIIIIVIGGIVYQQLQIMKLNQEKNCNLALTLVTLAKTTDLVDEVWVERGNQLSKRIDKNSFWFYPDVTMKEVGLVESVEDPPATGISIQDYYSSHNFFANGIGFWSGMIKMWDTSWKTANGTISISVQDVIGNNCPTFDEYLYE